MAKDETLKVHKNQQIRGRYSKDERLEKLTGFWEINFLLKHKGKAKLVD
jgi:hypothetical protein